MERDPSLAKALPRYFGEGAEETHRLVELEKTLQTCRLVLNMAQSQLEAAQKTVDEERSRNEALSARLPLIERSGCHDPNCWGLEPGVGL